MSDRLPVSLTPVSPARQREADLVSNRARLDAAQAASRGRNTLGEIVEGVGALAHVANRILEKDAVTKRSAAEAKLTTGVMEWMRNAASSDVPGSRLLKLFETDYEKMREESARELTYRPQRDLYDAETTHRQARLTEQVAAMAMEKTVRTGRATHHDAEASYISTGDIDAVTALWDDSFEAGFFGEAEMRRGGARDQSVRAAALNRLETEAQQLYDFEGVDAAEEYVLDPENHEASWNLSPSDLRSVVANVRGQAAAASERVVRQQNNEMASFITWGLPFEAGQQSAPTLRELDQKVEELLPSLPALRRAEVKRDSIRRFKVGAQSAAKGTSDPASAMRQANVLVGLNREWSEIEDSQIPHYRRVLDQHYINGDLPRTVYESKMRAVDKRIQGASSPGLDIIDHAIAVMTLTNAAGERNLDPDIRGTSLFEDGKRLELTPGEGDLLDVSDAAGNRLYRSLTAISEDLKAQLSSYVAQSFAAGQAPDVVTMSRQLLHRELVGMMPGVQKYEEVDAAGHPLPSDWQIVEQRADCGSQGDRPAGWARRRNSTASRTWRRWRPASSFVGEHGLMRNQITATNTPMGSAWTGAEALRMVNAPGVAMQLGDDPVGIGSPRYQQGTGDVEGLRGRGGVHGRRGRGRRPFATQRGGARHAQAGWRHLELRGRRRRRVSGAVRPRRPHIPRVPDRPGSGGATATAANRASGSAPEHSRSCRGAGTA